MDGRRGEAVSCFDAVSGFVADAVLVALFLARSRCLVFASVVAALGF
jgi:hypothetical protein